MRRNSRDWMLAAERARQGMMTEEHLGEQVRDACKKMGWEFYWLRKTIYSSSGILDLLLVPVTHLDRRHTLLRELKGYTFPAKGKPRLNKLSDEQSRAITLLCLAGTDAALWVPADWFSGRILEELDGS